MKTTTKQSSTTAEGMAIVRAIESSRPAERRLFYDPIAPKLVSPVKTFLSGLIIDSGLYGRMNKGAYEFITVRERVIDEFLKACLNEGMTQVVLLGAGFDTRPYRIPEMGSARVFEVDHPATQAEKRARLQKAVDPLPSNVTYVAIDFNTQTLEDRLLSEGYDEHVQTLFIWQGVIMYLTPEGVDNTLSFIAHHSAPGSAVIFDYFYTETLAGMRAARGITRAVGERIVFGIPEGGVELFLRQRGFTDAHNYTTDELRRLFFTGPNASRSPAPGAAIVSARVAG